MHSNIFQLSAKPISAGDFLYSEYFYDDCHFADYIGDEFNDEERHEKIKWLSVEFPEMFDFVNDEEYGEGLIFKGMGNFLAEWVKAIKDLKLPWPQMSDLKGWQCQGAAIYNVRAIPANVWVDKDGIIVAKDLRGENLINQLKSLLD